MAELIQLDAAATLVGKSEVTLRRLIKAGKIPFQKERTPTGFIYQVDPEVVRGYYQGREAVFTVPETSATHEVASSPRVRVAVASDSGTPTEYWQKKAEVYEERFNTEMKNHAQTREELGVWRGRAEQAQSMLVKLLPAPAEVQVQNIQAQSGNRAPQNATERAASSSVLTVVLTVLCITLIVVGGGVLYLHILGR